MTYFYRYSTSSTSEDGKPTKVMTEDQWQHIATKSNWRIVQLANGYYQTEYKEYGCEGDDCTWIDSTRRETIETAESSIDTTIAHYQRRLAMSNSPVIVKTFD
jgi:hypothetical protein